MVATGTRDTSQDNTTEVINLNNSEDICNVLGEISPRSNSVGGLVHDLPLICGGLGLNGRGWDHGCNKFDYDLLG